MAIITRFRRPLTQDKNGKRDNFDFLLLKLVLRILLTYSVFATGA